MTGYDDPYNPMRSPQPPKKGWFARNWWWLLLLIIGGLLFCCCGVPSGLYFIYKDKVFMVMQAYQQPLALAQNNERAIELIGEPMTAGNPTSSERQANGKNYLTLTYTVSGPNGSGVITAESELTMVEVLVSAELTIDGSGEVINLMNDGDDPDTADNPEGDADVNIQPSIP